MTKNIFLNKKYRLILINLIKKIKILLSLLLGMRWLIMIIMISVFVSLMRIFMSRSVKAINMESSSLILAFLFQFFRWKKKLKRRVLKIFLSILKERSYYWFGHWSCRFRNRNHRLFNTRRCLS